MESHILAIDQGTSGTKAVIFNKKGHIAAQATTPLLSIYPQSGFVEQDPQAIYQTVLDSVSACLEKFTSQHSLETILCCGISNQRETFLFWDHAGTPLGNAVVWQCKRSVDICNRLKKEALETEVSHRTGLILDPYFSGTKMLWCYENDAKIRKAIEAKNAFFGTVDSWLLYKLTQGRSYKTDYTNASRTLLFNINELQWDPFLIEQFGLSSLRFPDPLPSSSFFGASDFEGLFPHKLDICAMVGDSHASAFGQQCFSPGSAKVTIGTGSSVLLSTGNQRSVSQTGMMSTICWSTEERVEYALEGIIVSCGSTLTWLQEQLELFESFEELEQIALKVGTTAGVFLIPAFSGLGAPYWKMDAQAEIKGLTFDNNKQHVIRAALESIPFQIKDVVAAMEKDSNVPLKELKADGGISKNKFVMQFLADLLGVPVIQMGIEEVSALGAALLAGLHKKIYQDFEDLETLITSPIRYSTGKDCEVARVSHHQWQTLIQQFSK